MTTEVKLLLEDGANRTLEIMQGDRLKQGSKMSKSKLINEIIIIYGEQHDINTKKRTKLQRSRMSA